MGVVDIQALDEVEDLGRETDMGQKVSHVLMIEAGEGSREIHQHQSSMFVSSECQLAGVVDLWGVVGQLAARKESPLDWIT